MAYLSSFFSLNGECSHLILTKGASVSLDRNDKSQFFWVFFKLALALVVSSISSLNKDLSKGDYVLGTETIVENTTGTAPACRGAHHLVGKELHLLSTYQCHTLWWTLFTFNIRDRRKYSILEITVWSGCYCPNFTNEGTKAERGSVTCPGWGLYI